MHHVLRTYKFSVMEHVSFHDVVYNNADVNDVVVYLCALLFDFYNVFKEFGIPIVHSCVRSYDSHSIQELYCANIDIDTVEACFTELVRQCKISYDALTPNIISFSSEKLWCADFYYIVSDAINVHLR